MPAAGLRGARPCRSSGGIRRAASARETPDRNGWRTSAAPDIARRRRCPVPPRARGSACLPAARQPRPCRRETPIARPSSFPPDVARSAHDHRSQRVRKPPQEGYHAIASSKRSGFGLNHSSTRAVNPGLRAVIAVDGYVLLGEIARKYAIASAAEAECDANADLVALHIGGDFALGVAGIA